MTFAAVGSGYSVDATGVPTFSPNPVNVGDLFIATIVVENNTSYATGITGSNITWTQAGVTFLGTTTAFYVTTFLGKATATGSAVNTVAFSGTPNFVRGFAQEFSSTAGSWALDGSQGNVDANTANCPSLTPAHAGELYWCFARNAGSGSAGSTSGYTYFQDASGNEGCYNPACTSAAQAPVFGGTDTIVGTAILLREGTGPAFTQGRASPARIRPSLPPRGRIGFNPGSAPRNPHTGPAFRQRESLPLARPLPRRGTCRAIKFYPLIITPPTHAGPVFRQATSPARIRPSLPPRGRIKSGPGALPFALPTPGVSTGQPAGIRVIYQYTGRASSTPRYRPPPPLPARTPPLHSAVRIRPSLPPRGRVYSNPGTPARNPGANAAFRQATSPSRIRVTLPPRGRISFNPGAPVSNPHAGSAFGHQATSPSRARITLPRRGRVYSNKGAPVRNLHTGPVFVQASQPVRARIIPAPPKGRIESNPGSKFFHIIQGPFNIVFPCATLSGPAAFGLPLPVISLSGHPDLLRIVLPVPVVTIAGSLAHAGNFSIIFNICVSGMGGHFFRVRALEAPLAELAEFAEDYPDYDTGSPCTAWSTSGPQVTWTAG